MNMRTTKQISNTRHQHSAIVQTLKLRSILEQPRQRAQGIRFMRGGARGTFSKLMKAIRIEIRTGDQDKSGFHLGVKPAEKEVNLYRPGSLPSRRRITLFPRFHNRPLCWQSESVLTSRFNRLPSAYFVRRRGT